MRKQEFLDKLKGKLVGLPAQDVDERINFYSEMIDDITEEGASEEESVERIGSVDTVVAQILAETPLIKLAKERIKPKRRLTWWEITLLAVGSPIWLALLISAFSIVISLYVTLWALVASAWAVFAAFTACAPAGIAFGIGIAITVNPIGGIATVGAGFVSAGLAIFSFYGCMAATKGTAILTGKILFGIKKCFVGRRTLNENGN